jgi:hypothetical protein
MDDFIELSQSRYDKHGSKVTIRLSQIQKFHTLEEHGKTMTLVHLRYGGAEVVDETYEQVKEIIKQAGA